MQNTVVVHFATGKLEKGVTNDFFPSKEVFHINEKDSGEYREIQVRGLKAVFFVKSYGGNPDYQEKPDVERAGFGKRIRVRFKDGETQVGYTQGYAPDRTGFFVFPADPDSNNERIFVINAATDDIRFV